MSATTANRTRAEGSLARDKRLLIGCGAVALVVLLIGGYAGDWTWTGFSENDTLWDWLHLLLLPIAIASLPIWLSQGQYVHTRVRRIFAIGLAAFVLLVLLGYLVPWAWTGFTGNTLWDWLQLLLLPLVLTGVRLWPELQPRVLRHHIAAAMVIGWTLAALVLVGYLRPWEWTGFTGNTLWDWIQLVAVPLLLPLVILPLAMGYVRYGVDERRAEAEGTPADAPVDPATAALDHAVATATVSGPKVALAMLEPLQTELDGDYRLYAARAHLLEMAGHEWDAVADYRTAASEAPGHTEERYLLAQASRLAQQLERPL